jgi:hypothetical protein
VLPSIGPAARMLGTTRLLTPPAAALQHPLHKTPNYQMTHGLPGLWSMAPAACQALPVLLGSAIRPGLCLATYLYQGRVGRTPYALGVRDMAAVQTMRHTCIPCNPA